MAANKKYCDFHYTVLIYHWKNARMRSSIQVQTYALENYRMTFNAIPNVNIPTGMQIQQRNLLFYIAIIFTSVSEHHASVWLDTVISCFGAVLNNQQDWQFFLRLLGFFMGRLSLVFQDYLWFFIIFIYMCMPQNNLTQK